MLGLGRFLVAVVIMLAVDSFALRLKEQRLLAARGITVTSARYGENCDGIGADRTSYFASACNTQQSCSYVFKADATGGDPYWGCPKNLVVQFTCGGVPYSKTIPAEAGYASVVTISCVGVATPPPGIKVTSVLYGENCDGVGANRTSYFALACDTQRSCSVTFNAITMGGDPYWGCAKNLLVHYTCDGVPTNTIVPAEAGYGEVVELSCDTSSASPVTAQPTGSPTEKPTSLPTTQPTTLPTAQPTNTPTEQPTSTTPTAQPTSAPTAQPTNEPTAQPTIAPTQPTSVPTEQPTIAPTQPTSVPTEQPTVAPAPILLALPLGEPSASFSQDGYPITLATDGVYGSDSHGWAVMPHQSDTNIAYFPLQSPLPWNGNGQINVTMHFDFSEHILGTFRLSATNTLPPDSSATWLSLNPTRIEADSGVSFHLAGDGTCYSNPTVFPTDLYRLLYNPPPMGVITGFRLEAIPNADYPQGGSGSFIGGNGNFVLNEITFFRVS